MVNINKDLAKQIQTTYSEALKHDTEKPSEAKKIMSDGNIPFETDPQTRYLFDGNLLLKEVKDADKWNIKAVTDEYSLSGRDTKEEIKIDDKSGVELDLVNSDIDFKNTTGNVTGKDLKFTAEKNSHLNLFAQGGNNTVSVDGADSSVAMYDHIRKNAGNLEIIRDGSKIKEIKGIGEAVEGTTIASKLNGIAKNGGQLLLAGYDKSTDNRADAVAGATVSLQGAVNTVDADGKDTVVREDSSKGVSSLRNTATVSRGAKVTQVSDVSNYAQGDTADITQIGNGTNIKDDLKTGQRIIERPSTTTASQAGDETEPDETAAHSENTDNPMGQLFGTLLQIMQAKQEQEKEALQNQTAMMLLGALIQMAGSGANGTGTYSALNDGMPQVNLLNNTFNTFNTFNTVRQNTMFNRVGGYSQYNQFNQLAQYNRFNQYNRLSYPMYGDTYLQQGPSYSEYLLG